MPLTGEFRPSAVLGAISRAKNEMLDPTFLAENAVEPPRADHRPPRDALPGAPAQGRTRSTSTTCCSRPCGCSRRRPTSSPSTRSAGATSTSTNTRTPTAPQYLWVRALAATPPQPVRGRRRRPVDLLVARRRPAQHPRLRARLAGRRPSSSSSRTTARPSSSSTPPTRSSRATRRARTRSSGPRTQGGVRIQRFEAYNEEEEAEWIARQVEGLVGGRGTRPDPARGRRRRRTRASGPATSRSCTG